MNTEYDRDMTDLLNIEYIHLPINENWSISSTLEGHMLRHTVCVTKGFV